MTRLALVGLGTWSPAFANWQAFATGLATGEWPTDVVLQPNLIPSREHRRAPQLVKMAVEVMDQACNMAGLKPDDVATVFSSAMGDMQITDYMCAALAQTPKLISPTRFHNSVHNAAPGYWSIATGSFSPANAISAFQYTSTMAFLEAAIQVIEEDTPVLLVTQEVAAPPVLMDICPSKNHFSAAFLLIPSATAKRAICTFEITVREESSEWPELPPDLQHAFASNMSARLLPLMVELVALQKGEAPRSLTFPLSAFSSLDVTLGPDANRHA
jgi:hypothetical protein